MQTKRKFRNFIVDDDKKEIVILNYSDLTVKETRELKTRTELGGYVIVDRPKRKASPLSRLKKDQLSIIVKGNKEAEEFLKKNENVPFMKLKKLMKENFPDNFSTEAITKKIPSLKK